MNLIKKYIFVLGFFLACFSEDRLEEYYDKKFLGFFDDRKVLREVKIELWDKIEKNIIDILRQIRITESFLATKHDSKKSGWSFVWNYTKEILNTLFNLLSSEEKLFIAQFKKYFLNNNFFLKKKLWPSMKLNISKENFDSMITVNDPFYQLLQKVTNQKNIYPKPILEIALICFDISKRWNLFIFKAYIDKLKEKKKLVFDKERFSAGGDAKVDFSPKQFVLFSFGELLRMGEMLKKYMRINITKINTQNKIIIENIIKDYQSIIMSLYSSEKIFNEWSGSDILSSVFSKIIHDLFYRIEKNKHFYPIKIEDFVQNQIQPGSIENIMQSHKKTWKLFIQDLTQDDRMTVYT